MKCRLRESRLIAINEGERSLTAADVSAVYQINGDETKHSARNRMLANSHAGRGTRLPPTWKLAGPINTRAFVVTYPAVNFRSARDPGICAKRQHRYRLAKTARC
jgi:hypothetical protein